MKTNTDILEELWAKWDTVRGDTRLDVEKLILELNPITPAERKRWENSDPSSHWTLERAALTFRLFARILRPTSAS